MSAICIGEHCCSQAEAIEGSFHKTTPCRYWDTTEFGCNYKHGPLCSWLARLFDILYAAKEERNNE
jgi:hypothetical protein